MRLKIEKFEGNEITEDVLEAAAELLNESNDPFQYNVGIMGGMVVGENANSLRRYLLPSNAQNIYVRALADGNLAGNVFVTRWIIKGRQMCWITKLCVSSEYRNNYLAQLLLMSCKDKGDSFVGILSPHPFAICAMARSFVEGIKHVDPMSRDQANSIMRSCPALYVSSAKLHASFLGKGESVSIADTKSRVDHRQTRAAIDLLAEKGTKWPFQLLPEGHEYLVILEPKND